MMEIVNTKDMMKQQKAVVAMSGGVDSSVVAYLLHQQGYEVIGVTLQLYNHAQAINNPKSCCGSRDIADAKAVADMVGFKHYTLNYEDIFKEQVIDNFADSYLRGQTPLPCVRCNQSVKFNDLFKVAKQLDGQFLATGHYVKRVCVANNRVELHQGNDLSKDQSYFLFATTYEQLEYLRFPLGGLDKSQTRQIALEAGLPIADKPDSQDICFVPDGKYGDLVRKLRPNAIDRGDIIDIETGAVVGEHNGIIDYTIGQRRGIGVGGSKEPMYVIKIVPATNQIIIGAKHHLAKKSIFITDVNLISEFDYLQPLSVKYRSNQSQVAAKFNPDNQEVVFTTGQYGIASGQACVLYNDSQVLGGGWIM
jgi:tRNA-specific 2-thiouridylase